MNSPNEGTDYKLTDLDYLVGDHHLQMLKASLPFLSIPQQRALSLFIKVQELRRTSELFVSGQAASMGICSLEAPAKRGSLSELLKAVRPYASPAEQDRMDLVQNLMDGQTPIEQLRRFLTPEQLNRIETIQMVIAALQAMT